MTPDLIIVGAGPAGLSAAIEARTHGLSVVLLDENATPGGRIWQALEHRHACDADDAEGRRVVQAFRTCGAEAHWRAAVWAVEPDGRVFWSQDGTAHTCNASFVLLCTGTIERPMPISGWTLPGVMTVGAAQIAWKVSDLVPAGLTWIAGQGPLLVLYAAQMLRAGGCIAGILDLSDGLAPFRAMRHLTAAVRGLDDLARGLGWRREISHAGVPWFSAHSLRAEGDHLLQRIAFCHGGTDRTEPADLLLLHDGVIPSVEVTRALGCVHAWEPTQRCWKPATDPWGVTSLPNILVAGDGARVSGARAAMVSGRIAALHVAYAMGRVRATLRDALAAPLRTLLVRHRASRRFLDVLYAPRPSRLGDATIVCRCEEVTARQIRDAARIGCLGLNQLKAFTRCGMGVCQGRMCGTTAAEVLAEARAVPVNDIAPYRARIPTRPLTVRQLAELALD